MIGSMDFSCIQLPLRTALTPPWSSAARRGSATTAGPPSHAGDVAALVALVAERGGEVRPPPLPSSTTNGASARARFAGGVGLLRPDGAN